MKLLILIAHLETGLDKGTLFKWNDYDWIILKKMFRPDQPGFNGIAIVVLDF